MKRFLDKTITPFLIAVIFLSACKKEVTDTNVDTNGGTGKGKANVVMGNIYDAKGKKFNISGANVVVHVFGQGNIGETDPAYNIDMDGNSHYELKVANSVYQFHARAYMPLNGNKVCIDLQSLDGKADNLALASAPGIVKDFGLKLTGQIPGGDPNTIQGYYGAKIYMCDGASSFDDYGYWNNLAAKYPGANITFTLEPKSALIDGSEGEIRKLEASVDELKQGKWYVDVPYAWYRVTAVLVTQEGEQRQLKLSHIPGTENRTDFVDLLFPPDPDDHDGVPVKPEIAVWEN